MNPYVSDSDGSFHYYDSDYPWPEEMRDDPGLLLTAARQGIIEDVPHYLAVAALAEAEMAGGVLELACGTGRLLVPMARGGHRVTGVDASPVMLEGLRRRLERETPLVRDRVSVVQADLLSLDLPQPSFALAVLGFNGLMLIADFDSQIQALERIRAHLAPGGRLAMDIANPLMLPLGASTTPEASYTRINRRTGNLYTKFAMVGQLDARQVQRLHGWYDEVMPDGAVRRSHYAFEWRPIFRYELELMLHRAGFDIEQLDGGFQGEPFDAHSAKTVVVARRRE